MTVHNPAGRTVLQTTLQNNMNQNVTRPLCSLSGLNHYLQIIIYLDTSSWVPFPPVSHPHRGPNPTGVPSPSGSIPPGVLFPLGSQSPFHPPWGLIHHWGPIHTSNTTQLKLSISLCCPQNNLILLLVPSFSINDSTVPCYLSPRQE